MNANNLVIYTFTNFTLAPGAFHHVTPVFSLPEASTKVQLRNNRGAVLLEVKYSPKTPWPAEANGAGHSLVLARPSYGENDPRAWVASEKRGGSPGYAETNHVDFLRTVKINEFLAATAPFIDAIELYNAGNQPIDISGCYLARNPSNLTEYAIPAGTILQPRGFIDFSLFDFPGFNINLNQTGDAIYLTNPDQTRVLDAVAFEDQELYVSTGRSPDGAPNLVRQAAYSLFGPTFTNGPARSEQIVINEIMFNPVSGNIFASSSNSTIQAPIP